MPKQGTKHIFETLSPNPEDPIHRGTGIDNTQNSILRRMLQEVLPVVPTWTSEITQGNPLARKTIKETIKNKTSFKEAPQEEWEYLLQLLVNRELEIHAWKTVPNLLQWAINPQKNLFCQRAFELVEAQEAESILLLGWHQHSGILAAEILTNKTTLIEKENPLFPRIRAKMISQILIPNHTEVIPAKLVLWNWSKTNFQAV